MRPLIPSEGEYLGTPAHGSDLARQSLDALFGSLVGAGTFGLYDRTPLRLEQVVREISEGDWHPHNTRNGLEKSALQERVSVALIHWEKTIPDPIQLTLEASDPLVCLTPSGLRCAFMLVCKDPSQKHLWLNDDLTPTGTKTDYSIGNLWIVDTDDSARVRTIYSEQAVADLMVQAAEGVISPPEWVQTELTEALKFFRENQRAGDLVKDPTPLVIHEILIAGSGSSGIAKTSVGDFDVAFGIDQRGLPCVRIVHPIQSSEPKARN